MVVVVEGILVVAKIIKFLGTMIRTSFELQTLPPLLTVGFIVLMDFGWLIVTNVIPGVELPMFIPLVSMMMPF